MRFIAPPRDAIDPAVFARPPLADWLDFAELLRAAHAPSIREIEALRDKIDKNTKDTLPHFVEQTPQLLADGMHYEMRIAAAGQVATRANNWHDLLNALIWLRYPSIKRALNRRQVEEIARVGPKQRSRAQYALTHFDEAGVIACVRDARLLELWDAHDWRALFLDQRSAWSDGRIEVYVFGHALLEHALQPDVLFVGKALVVAPPPAGHSLFDAVADVIATRRILNDPQELRPLPLSALPGWHARGDDTEFYRDAPCFRPLRDGRVYPVCVALPSRD